MGQPGEKVSNAMSPPGPEHERLKPFAGKFRAKVTIWMGPGEPMVSTGVMVNTLDLGGRFLRHEYKGDPHPGPFESFEGRGFWGYNTALGHYEGVWVDNASTIMQTDTGSVDQSGRVWTMTGEMPDPQGRMMTKRSVITLHDEDHHTMEMFFVKDGRDHKAMEIEYERVR